MSKGVRMSLVQRREEPFAVYRVEFEPIENVV